MAKNIVLAKVTFKTFSMQVGKPNHRMEQNLHLKRKYFKVALVTKCEVLSKNVLSFRDAN